MTVTDETTESEPVSRTPFAEVHAQAYGWTLDDEGYLCGLVAGDMGYEQTDMKFTDFFVDAQVAERKRLFATGNFPCRWPVSEVTIDFINACYDELKPRP